MDAMQLSYWVIANGCIGSRLSAAARVAARVGARAQSVRARISGRGTSALVRPRRRACPRGTV